MRRAFFVAFTIVGMLFGLMFAAHQPAAFASSDTTDVIESIMLTISPSFGTEDEMVDTVRIFVPNEKLTSLLCERNFHSMPEYLETGVLDGHFTWIIVKFVNGESKRVGGLVAEEFGPEGFIAIYNALIQAEEISGYLSGQEADVILRLSIYPTGTTGESYYFELRTNDVLYCSVGVRINDDITEPVFLIETEYSIETKLSTSDYQLLLGLAYEMEASGYVPQKLDMEDAWDVALLYKGKVYEMNYWHNADSKVLYDLTNRIILFSILPVDLHGWA